MIAHAFREAGELPTTGGQPTCRAVAVRGYGPVGQSALRSGWLPGAGRVIAIDWFPERLRMAAQEERAETIDDQETDVRDRLIAMTHG